MMARQSLQRARQRRRQANRSKLRVLILLAALSLLLPAGLALSRTATGQERGTLQLVVAEGDTLWSLAAAHLPRGRDIREYVDEIIFINSLVSPLIRAGQVLNLPR